jgi:hypothetical protein
VTAEGEHVYRLYGVALRSSLALPFARGSDVTFAELEVNEGGPDFFTELTDTFEVPDTSVQWLHDVPLADGSRYLRWSGLFQFLISNDGLRVTGNSLDAASRESFYAYLFGQVLSIALVKQGIEPLHATTVVIDGQAVAFLGDCGYGKSSLAAAFLRAGHPVLTDDLLVLRPDAGAWYAHAGPARIKLFPEIAGSLLGKDVSGTPLNRLTPKLIIPLESGPAHWPEPVALKAIYVLNRPNAVRSSGVRITRLKPRRALMELLTNTFESTTTDKPRLERQFRFAADVARQIPVKLLSYRRTLDTLPAVREALLKDLERNSFGGARR